MGLRFTTILAVLGIYTTLALLFQSYFQPLYVLSAIPMGFVGIMWGFQIHNEVYSFFSLLGALGMSNGQLTHHLKHLQGEERVWRRKDGRLVRFYPASIQATLNDDELPVPLLTPDPNSLQGKILRLLDATENDIVNLSQKELAVRLEASQQLVSHHLRTLEKFGLVEREKVGMRYRYQLTREAIFLVNSNDYDVKPE